MSGYNSDYEFALSGQEEGGFLQFKFSSPKGQMTTSGIQMKCSFAGGGQGFAYTLPIQRGFGDVRMEKKDGAKQEVDLSSITGGMFKGTGVLTLHLYKD